MAATRSNSKLIVYWDFINKQWRRLRCKQLGQNQEYDDTTETLEKDAEEFNLFWGDLSAKYIINKYEELKQKVYM